MKKFKKINCIFTKNQIKNKKMPLIKIKLISLFLNLFVFNIFSIYQMQKYEN
jgi:hypothetical protein